ncbi:class I SAM-dependent methyltransferase [Kocuria sp. NPDC057446]|uniref:class I SAM-dependent methyltransferase n=1 Tax=Kocuria sp. NPDC057446 TaxID=3346137 RepID=UPI0036AD41F4
MVRGPGVAPRLAGMLGIVLGTDRIPVRLRAWDGSEAGSPGAPVIEIRSRRTLRRLLWSPGQLGLSRAYVAGELDLPGDLFATVAALTATGRLTEPVPLTARERWRLLRSAAALGALGPEPAPPPEEVHLAGIGGRHSKARDAAAVSHHYDLGNDFYAVVLGPSMVYSCAVWDDPSGGLEAAQAAKHDLVCRKLGLRSGMRVLDVGCGWGAFALHAARHHEVDVVGVTLSPEQATLGRERVRAAGLAERIDIRVQDYRDVDDGPFDAVSSIGMSEHVGDDQIDGYASHLHGLLRPGARLLNHAIARRTGDPRRAGEARQDPSTFMARYVFPDTEVLSLTRTIGALEAGGLEILDVEALRLHYPLTLRAWAQRLEEHWSEAVRLVGEGRARTWRLYLVAAAWTFESGRQGVNQVLVQRPGGTPPPLARPWRTPADR